VGAVEAGVVELEVGVVELEVGAGLEPLSVCQPTNGLKRSQSKASWWSAA
jgi:hypothetical protein